MAKQKWSAWPTDERMNDIMKPIYEPKGRAREYGDYALNIYTGCPHRCYYCFAPGVLRKDREAFHSNVAPRDGIVEATKRQLDKEQIAGKLIHLCFTCDPYPMGINTFVTREIIRAIKDSGNHVQILTKGGTESTRDFDLLDENDWFGVTITGAERTQEPGAAHEIYRKVALQVAKAAGINTWASCEPVIEPSEIYLLIRDHWYIDRFKIGKLNYHPSDIDWGEFGRECERLCKKYGRDYYIKEDLRKLM